MFYRIYVLSLVISFWLTNESYNFNLTLSLLIPFHQRPQRVRLSSHFVGGNERISWGQNRRPRACDGEIGDSGEEAKPLIWDRI
jgi:hypothetical protein